MYTDNCRIDVRFSSRCFIQGSSSSCRLHDTGRRVSCRILFDASQDDTVTYSSWLCPCWHSHPYLLLWEIPRLSDLVPSNLLWVDRKRTVPCLRRCYRIWLSRSSMYPTESRRHSRQSNHWIISIRSFIRALNSPITINDAVSWVNGGAKHRVNSFDRRILNLSNVRTWNSFQTVIMSSVSIHLYVIHVWLCLSAWVTIGSMIHFSVNSTTGQLAVYLR